MTVQTAAPWPAPSLAAIVAAAEAGARAEILARLHRMAHDPRRDAAPLVFEPVCWRATA